jgi:hypothetical protein
LAKALYSSVREGQAIPGPLFRAVAEVLAFVYRVRGSASDRTPVKTPQTTSIEPGPNLGDSGGNGPIN